MQLAVVTGAAGFVGSHLVDRLLAEGYRVIGVDNLITGRKLNLAHLAGQEKFRLIEADVNQSTTEYLDQELLHEQQPDLMFHLASPASPPRYQAHPVETYLVNSLGTHHLLSWIKQHSSTTKFIFASTSEVYGDPQVHPQPETYFGNVNPNGIRSCYDESKRLGESICGIFSRDFGLDVRIARIFNTYGSRMDPEDGRVIPNFIAQAQAGQPYTIYGDGSQTRSYCFVTDLVDGLWKLATVPAAKGATINLGNPKELTILETAEIIHQLIRGQEAKFEVDHLPFPQDDPTRRRPDIAKARQLLSWQPQVDLSEGLTQTI